jgi:hypothetical protein
MVVTLMCAGLAVASAARAQDVPAAASSAGPEVTPYAFLGSGTSSGVGAAIRWPLPAHLSIELDTSYRRAEVNGLSSGLSLLFDFPDIGRVTPYAAAGVGLEQYGTAERSPAGALVTQGRTALSVNAGGGLRVRGEGSWGIRTDARWSNGIGERAPERWRLFNGVTFKAQ